MLKQINQIELLMKLKMPLVNMSIMNTKYFILLLAILSSCNIDTNIGHPIIEKVTVNDITLP